MAQIKRTSRGARVRLEGNEVQLLGQLADEVDLLLSGNADDATPPSARPAPSGEPASPDELAELTGLAGLTWPTADEVEVPDDPALRRLLPNAYRDDAEAAAEFRRYTDATLRGGKRADVTVVRQGLASIGAAGERVLDDAQVQAWLRFLTDARLVLASRLGIETASDAEALEALDADDPRFMAYAVYEWLVSVLGGLLGAIDA